MGILAMLSLNPCTLTPHAFSHLLIRSTVTHTRSVIC